MNGTWTTTGTAARSGLLFLSFTALLGATSCGSPQPGAATPSQSSGLPTAVTCPTVAVPPVSATPLPEAPGSIGLQATIATPAGPAGVAIGFGSVWVAVHRGADVLRVDPTTNAVVATVHIPPSEGHPSTAMGPITVGPDGVWLPIIGGLDQQNPTVPNQLMRVDPATNSISFDEDFDGLYDVSDDASGVWAGVDPGQSLAVKRPELIKVDPASGQRGRTIDLGPAEAAARYTAAFGAGFGSLWVTTDGNRVERIDPASGRVTARINTLGPAQQVVAGGPGADVFLAVTFGANRAAVARVDPATNCVDAVAFVGTTDAEGSIAVAASPNRVYVNFGKGSLAEVDPATMQTTRSVNLDTQDFLGYIRYGFGSIWVPTFGDNSVLRVGPPS
jgi:hypothetical protein